MSRFVPALAAAILGAASPASALSFFDGFEGETSGSSILNYAGFANWMVVSGTVDLIRSGEHGITCRTNNYCVDLDGSGVSPGVLTLKTPIAINPGDFVNIVVWLSGNQRGGWPDTVKVSLSFTDPIPVTNFWWLLNGIYIPVSPPSSITGAGLENTFNPSDAFGSFGFRFTAGGATSLTLRLKNSGFDYVGAILDDVSITVRPAGVIPEPATWAMLIAGFGLVGAAARRRKLAAA